MLQPVGKAMEFSRYDGVYQLDILAQSPSGADPLTPIGVQFAALESIEGSFAFQRGNYEPRHYNLLYVLEGGLRLETPEEDYSVPAGAFLQVPSHIHRRLQTVGPRYRGLYFSGLEDNQPGNLLRTNSVRTGMSSVLSRLEQCVLAFLEEKQYRPHASSVILDACLLLIVEYLKRDLDGDAPVPAPLSIQNLERLNARIFAHPAADWSVKHLARLLGCSPTRLNTLIHQYYQCSPLEHVNQVRMEKAALLLRSNRYTLAEIAAMVGFRSVFSFSTRFLKTMGLRPSAFRKTLE